MERRAIEIRGIVQGVGFRPFLYNLALRWRLGGFVRNQTGSVLVEVEGESASVDRFLAELAEQPPPLAKIDQITWETTSLRGECEFHIEQSAVDPTSSVQLAPDAATCAECLAELFDPADRRYGYPFINCTNCGPRLTIITGSPYDRPRTTMSTFALCSICQAEYDDPANRRFHAQPTACPICGPQLQLLDAAGMAIETLEPLTAFAAALQAGKIGALKGLGGYHLVCDARNRTTVAELRRRKHRDEKSLAVMVGDLESAAALCEVGEAERTLLRSVACPIVLLRKRLPNQLADEVAPGNPWLGVMVPYTPLHHLLLRATNGMPLVMTSGNRSDEPIAYWDSEAIEKLAGIADLFLVHNRPIHVRCDDSVTRIVDGNELLVRRSRGYAPRPIALPFACPVPIGALGGQLKATFALGRDRLAFLSHHLGDLDHFEAYQAYVKDLALYEELFQVRPEVLAHDLHPDYATTILAREQSAQLGSRLLAVQHHHAHLASCMAENGLIGPVIGVIFDGTGYGLDQTIWGGEFLIGDYTQFQRAAHLRYVRMPGGEQAIHEPWRMAIAHLTDAKATCPQLEARLLQSQIRTIQRMLETGFNSPQTSSAGRLFDAVAALAGIRYRVSNEGQAAIELEWLASGLSSTESYPFEIRETLNGVGPLVADTRPLIRAVAEEVSKGVEQAVIARRFHSTVVEFITAICERIRGSTGIESVVLSGGVFLNALLTSEVSTRLREESFHVHRHRLVPPSDGGLSLGQLAVAAASLHK